MADDAGAVAAPKQTVAPTVAPQASDAPAPTAGAESAAPVDPEAPKPDAKPERTFSQEDVNKFLARSVAKERRRIEREIRASVENEYLRRQIGDPRQDANAGQGSGSPGKPELKSYPDYESWVEAVADWRAEQKIDARIKAESERHRAQAEKAQSDERRAYFQERVVDKGNSLYEDFEDVALAPDLPMTESMVETMADSDHGAAVAYYLGQHPEEAHRISKLSKPAQVREVDKLIATLTKPAEPTKAPAPIKPNSATGSVSTRLEDASMVDFIKIRRRQLAQK